MKKITLISGTIIIAAIISSSYWNLTPKLKVQGEKNTKEVANNTALILKAKAGSLSQQNSVDSLNKINAINDILGEYESSKRNVISYAGGDVDNGPKTVISVTNNKEIIKVKQVSLDDATVGETEASAEMLNITKIGTGLYKLNMKKLKCHYINNWDGNGEEYKNINIEELTPSNNSDFTIIIDFTNKNAITFKSTAIKTECLGAWELERSTFVKK